VPSGLITSIKRSLSVGLGTLLFYNGDCHTSRTAPNLLVRCSLQVVPRLSDLPRQSQQLVHQVFALRSPFLQGGSGLWQPWCRHVPDLATGKPVLVHPAACQLSREVRAARSLLYRVAEPLLPHCVLASR